MIVTVILSSGTTRTYFSAYEITHADDMFYIRYSDGNKAESEVVKDVVNIVLTSGKEITSCKYYQEFSCGAKQCFAQKGAPEVTCGGNTERCEK